MRRLAGSAFTSATTRAFHSSRVHLEKAFGIFIEQQGQKRIHVLDSRTKITEIEGSVEGIRDNSIIEFDIVAKAEGANAAANVQRLKPEKAKVFSVQKNGAGIIENLATNESHAVLSANPSHLRSLFPGVEVEAEMYKIRGLPVARIRRVVNRSVTGTVVKALDKFSIVRVTTADGSVSHYHARRSEVRAFAPLTVGETVTFDIDTNREPEEGKLRSAINVQLVPTRQPREGEEQGQGQKQRRPQQQDDDAAVEGNSTGRQQRPRRPQQQQQRDGDRPHQQQRQEQRKPQQQQRKPAPDDDLDLDDANLFKN